MTGGVLFHARNRRGLGHLMRVQNLARAVHERAPETGLHIHASRRPDPALWDRTVPLTTDADESWAATCRRVRPAVVVHDTKPADDLASPAGGPATVLVMRKRRADQHDVLLRTPGLDRVDCFVIPHEEDEFDLPLPPSIAHRCHFVGPIARSAHPQARGEMRSQFGLTDTGLLITATVGGGGFIEQANRFFELVSEIVPAVTEGRPGTRAVIVVGPNYDNPTMVQRLRELQATTIVDVEPRMVDLLAASDLVIAEGGYNTVTEIRTVGVPAVFIPSVRTLDDQRERVEHVAATGAAMVVDPSRPASDAVAVVREALAGNRLAVMRSAMAAHPPRLGNHAAADLILGLAR